MLEDLVSIKGLAAAVPALNESTMRAWIFHNVDGFRDMCVTKVGSRIYLNKVKVAEWFEQHGAKL